MPSKFTPEKQLVFLKAMLDYFHGGAEVMGTTDNLDIYARHLILLLYVVQGELEGRPFTAVDLANATGMSRTTVQREVFHLERQGVLRVTKQGRRKIVMQSCETAMRLKKAYLKISRELVERLAPLSDRCSKCP